MSEDEEAKRMEAMKKDRETWPRDTAVIHQPPRGSWAPSVSPYPMKLETYCRIAKIPFVPEFNHPGSTKGKTPWMTYNDDDVADSHFCIQYLNKKFNVDLNSHLTAEQKVIGRAFQALVEDHLFWTLVADRYIHCPMDEVAELFGPLLPREILVGIVERMGDHAKAQGMGRHRIPEIREIGFGDLEALNEFIGNKKFLFGDKVCEHDASVFGMMATVKYHSLPSSPFGSFLKEKCLNLVEYVDRMKTTFWPDWDECITHGHTKTATK